MPNPYFYFWRKKRLAARRNLVSAGISLVGRSAEYVPGRDGTSPYNRIIDISEFSPESGDLLVTYIAAGSSGYSSIDILDSGDPLIALTDSGIDITAKAYTKIIEPGDTSVTLYTGLSTSIGIAVFVELYRGIDGISPRAQVQGDNNRITTFNDFENLAEGHLVSAFAVNSEALPVDNGFDDFLTLETFPSSAAFKLYSGAGNIASGTIPNIGPAVEGAGDSNSGFSLVIGAEEGIKYPFISSRTPKGHSGYRAPESSSMSFFEPALPKTGDLRVMVIVADNNGTTPVDFSITPPAGWTSHSIHNANGLYMQVLYSRDNRVPGSASFLNIPYVTGETVAYALRIFTVTDVVDIPSPIEGLNFTTGTGTTITAPDVTTTQGLLNLSLNVWQTDASVTLDEGYNNLVVYNNTQGWDNVLSISSKGIPVAGTIPGEVIELASSQKWVNCNLQLRRE